MFNKKVNNKLILLLYLQQQMIKITIWHAELVGQTVKTYTYIMEKEYWMCEYKTQAEY